jgi:hypothetical protein
MSKVSQPCHLSSYQMQRWLGLLGTLRFRRSQPSVASLHCDALRPPTDYRAPIWSFCLSSPGRSLWRMGAREARAMRDAHWGSCLGGLAKMIWIPGSYSLGISLDLSLSNGWACKLSWYRRVEFPQTTRKWSHLETTNRLCGYMEALKLILVPCKEGYPWLKSAQLCW